MHWLSFSAKNTIVENLGRDSSYKLAAWNIKVCVMTVLEWILRKRVM